MPPFVAVFVKLRWEFPVRLRRNDRNNPRVIQIFTQPVGIKSAICKEHLARDALDQLRCFTQIMGLPRHQTEGDQVAKRIGQREDFGGNSAARLPYSLTLSPPFAPCPWRWTLQIVPSIITHSMSGSSDTASNIRLKTSALTQ